MPERPAELFRHDRQLGHSEAPRKPHSGDRDAAVRLHLPRIVKEERLTELPADDAALGVLREEQVSVGEHPRVLEAKQGAADRLVEGSLRCLRLDARVVADGDGVDRGAPSRSRESSSIAFFVILIDGAAANWSAVHLRAERDASAAVAAAGFTAFALAVALARLVGDRLVARLGRVRFVRIAGLVAAGGSALVIAAPAAALEVVGWAVVGAGLAAIPPTLFGAAPHVGAVPTPVAIAAVSTLGYLGSFTGPPAIGALAQVTNLTAALGLLVAAALATSLLASRALSPRPDHHAQAESEDRR
jgi:hypothetical protein